MVEATAGVPWAVIPTCGLSPHLFPLIQQLASARVPVCVITNGMDPDQEAAFAARVVQYGGTCYKWPGRDADIYGMWNWAILKAREVGVSSLAILNDDIEIDGRDARHIDNILVDYPDIAIVGWDYHDRDWTGHVYVRGSYRHGGVAGYAFAVNPNKVPLIDERFNWWGGDDDLFFGAEKAGYRLALALGVRVIHHHSVSANARPRVFKNLDDDRALLLSKWGDTW